MYCNKTLNAKINAVHKRALRAVTRAYNHSFEELLSSVGGLTIHQRNLQVLLIEIFKCMSGSYPDIVKTLFVLKETPYSLRNSLLLKLPPTKSV